MAVLLAWVSWQDDEPNPADWQRMVDRAAARTRYPGRALAAPGVRLFCARTRASEPDPLVEDGRSWLAFDSPAGHGGKRATSQSGVRIDLHERRLEAWRDVLGRQRLAYAELPAGLILASGEHILLAHSGLLRTFDEQFLAAFVANLPSAPEASAFAHIRQLRSGETRVWCDRRSSGSLRRLTPDPGWRSMRKSGAIAELKARVLNSVAQTTADSLRVGLALSGGMDSAAIAAALSIIDVPPQPVAITYGFDRWPTIDERDLAADVARSSGLAHLSFPADDCFPLSNGARPVCPDAPFSSPFREIKEASYGLMREAGVDVWLAGDFGDHLAADPSDWLSDAWRQRRFGAAVDRLCWNLQERGLRRGIWSDAGIRRAARGMFKPPAWPGLEFLQADHREALRSRLDLELQALSAFPRPLQAYHVLNARSAYSASGENWFANRHGMENRLPFRDPELTRWMLSLPVDFSFRGGTWKWILRQAFAPHLPDSISARPKSSDLTPFVDAACADHQRDWDALAVEGRALVEPLVEPTRIASADIDDAWNLRWAFIGLTQWLHSI